MNVAMQTNPMQADQVSWRCEQFIGGRPLCALPAAVCICRWC
jgi:hypothetical protein